MIVFVVLNKGEKEGKRGKFLFFKADCATNSDKRTSTRAITAWRRNRQLWVTWVFVKESKNLPSLNLSTRRIVISMCLPYGDTTYGDPTGDTQTS
jgi:hypothetical protein